MIYGCCCIGSAGAGGVFVLETLSIGTLSYLSIISQCYIDLLLSIIDRAFIPLARSFLCYTKADEQASNIHQCTPSYTNRYTNNKNKKKPPRKSSINNNPPVITMQFPNHFPFRGTHQPSIFIVLHTQSLSLSLLLLSLSLL
jgi:hypothetical protein